jgi:pimeloyl-ACP methyl ester carboxylesterase
MPDARLVRIPEAGHSVYFERPGEYNRVVDAFLAEHTGIPPRIV